MTVSIDSIAPGTTIYAASNDSCGMRTGNEARLRLHGPGTRLDTKTDVFVFDIMSYHETL